MDGGLVKTRTSADTSPAVVLLLRSVPRAAGSPKASSTGPGSTYAHTDAGYGRRWAEMRRRRRRRRRIGWQGKEKGSVGRRSPGAGVGGRLGVGSAVVARRDSGRAGGARGGRRVGGAVEWAVTEERQRKQDETTRGRRWRRRRRARWDGAREGQDWDWTGLDGLEAAPRLPAGCAVRRDSVQPFRAQAGRRWTTRTRRQLVSAEGVDPNDYNNINEIPSSPVVLVFSFILQYRYRDHVMHVERFRFSRGCHAHLHADNSRLPSGVCMARDILHVTC